VTAPTPAALAVEEVSKTFPGGKALDRVSFALAPGQVHGLIGGNGSGKSTLVKALAGIQPADPGGVVRVGGDAVDADHLTPAWARRHGLRFVHQDPGMFPSLTVAENFALGNGYPHRAGRLVSWRQLRTGVAKLLERFQIDARPEQKLESLRPADRTMIAIARAMQDRYDVGEDAVRALVLDEPTASLPKGEVEILLRAIRTYVEDGLAIIFISHRLDEVRAICDTVTVLRDGSLVDSRPAAGLDERDLVRMIVGRELERFEAIEAAPAEQGGRVVAGLSGVAVGPLHDVNFEVRAGEILGIAGLLGSGRTEILQTLFGELRPEAGTVTIDGAACRLGGPAAAMDKGIAFVPEDRAEAIFPSMSVRENFSISVLSRYSRGLLNRVREKRDAKLLLDSFGVKSAGYEIPISFLSGGNQQKVVLARWLNRKPRLLLLDEPTQGVDVGARADAYAIVREAAAEGMAVVVVSSDFEELAELCDRVLVLADGVIAGETSGENLDSAQLTERVHTAKGPSK